MLSFVAKFNEALRGALDKRYLPKWLWLESRRKDRFGRDEFELRDSAGQRIITYGPRHAFGLLEPDFERPFVLGPGNLIGHPNSELLFHVSEPSLYSNYWEGYPRRFPDLSFEETEKEQVNQNEETGAAELEVERTANTDA
jgi:hypothetical protein